MSLKPAETERELSGWTVIDAKVSYRLGSDAALIRIDGTGFKWDLTDYEKNFLNKI